MCSLPIPLPAHHSFGAEYDTSKPVSLTGIVTKIEWTNPHSFLYVDVKDDNGGVINWKLEGYPPGVLYRIKEDDLSGSGAWQTQPVDIEARAEVELGDL